MAKKKPKIVAPPAQLEPLRSCEICSGTGWVQGSIAPAKTNEVTGRRIEYSPPVTRCPCTTRGQRLIDEAREEIDQARRASGERIEP